MIIPFPLTPMVAAISLTKRVVALPQLTSRTESVAMPSTATGATSESSPQSSDALATEKTTDGISDAELIGYGAVGIVGLIVLTVAILMYRRHLRNKKAKLPVVKEGGASQEEDDSEDEDEKRRDSFDSIDLERNHAGQGTVRPYRKNRLSEPSYPRQGNKKSERRPSSPTSESDEEQSPTGRPRSRPSSGVPSKYTSEARANRKAARKSKNESSSDEDSDDSYVERSSRKR